MMSLVRMEKYVAVVSNNDVAITRRKYRIHERQQTHTRRYDPWFIRNRLRDFNLISPSVFRGERLQPKLMRTEFVETFFPNIFEIRSTGNGNVLCVVTSNAPLRSLHSARINPGNSVKILILCIGRLPYCRQYIGFVYFSLLINIRL